VRGDASAESRAAKNNGACQLRFRPPGHGEPLLKARRIKTRGAASPKSARSGRRAETPAEKTPDARISPFVASKVNCFSRDFLLSCHATELLANFAAIVRQGRMRGITDAIAHQVATRRTLKQNGRMKAEEKDD